MNEIPTHARFVIIGGGVIGTSIAYHLAKAGEADVLLLERDRLTSGTTWHAAGLVGTAGMHGETPLKLARRSLDIYRGLEAETGQATGFRACGFLQLAGSRERLELLRREMAFQRMFGVDKVELSVAEIAEHAPLLKTSDLHGAIFSPHDGRVNPVDVTTALAIGARRRGVRIIEGLPVTGLIETGTRVVGVRTDRGDVTAETVILAAGMWSRQIGSSVGISLPLQAAEHYYLLTENLPAASDMPVVEDADSYAYFREEVGGLLVGLFEPDGAVWRPDGIPEDASFMDLQPNTDRIAPFLEAAFARVPALSAIGIRKLFCGPESFTPDASPLVGYTPERDGLFVCCGLNSIGVLSGGGMGELVANWLLTGNPGEDVTGIDVGRLPVGQSSRGFLEARTVEMLGAMFSKMLYPTWQPQTARNFRLSPVHARTTVAGAYFIQSSGWEVPLFFDSERRIEEVQLNHCRQPWYDLVAAEHRAVREAAGLFDMTLMAKFLIEGPGALALLDRLSTNRIDVEVGRNVYTCWCNDQGQILADLTVTRLAPDRFLVVASDVLHRQVEAHLMRHSRIHAPTVITDITSTLAILSVQGPAARAVLQQVSPADLSDSALPFRASAEIQIGGTSARIVRVTFVGERGYELYVPSEVASATWDLLIDAGQAHGLRPCGLAALGGLRLEKGYRDYGHDIDNGDTVFEAGLGFVVAFGKGEFIGRTALFAQKEKPALQRRMIHVLLEDPEPLLFHGEPILANGNIVGYVRSGGVGFTLGASVGLGFVEHVAGVNESWLNASNFEIDVAGRRHKASVSLKPFYDPSSARLRG